MSNDIDALIRGDTQPVARAILDIMAYCDRYATGRHVRPADYAAHMAGSLADVFDNEVPESWRVELFQLIRETPNLDWLLVTKRIGNAQRMAEAAGEWPENVWLGATIVNQEEANRDVPKLLQTRGPRIRFLSMEPLLGPVDLRAIRNAGEPGGPLCGLTGYQAITSAGGRGVGYYFADDDEPIPMLNWIIVGGESGPGARPMHPDWLISLRDQCEAYRVPFLFKQWGEHEPVFVDAINATGFEFRRVGKKAAGRRLHGQTHDGAPT